MPNCLPPCEQMAVYYTTNMCHPGEAHTTAIKRFCQCGAIKCGNGIFTPKAAGEPAQHLQNVSKMEQTSLFFQLL